MDDLKALRDQIDRIAEAAVERYANWSRSPEETVPPAYLEGYADGLGLALSVIEAHIVRQPQTELEERVNDLSEYSFDEEW